MLALSNEPQQLVEMVLDKLLHLLKVDYGWVQLVSSQDRNLRLVASRGRRSEMMPMLSLMDSQRNLGERVVVGSKVVVPDLSRDSRDGLSLFGLAGFRSLVAVPIRTYRTQGVIGVASRTKKRLDKEVAELLMTVAGLVGAALNVAELGRIALDRERQRVAEEVSKEETVAAESSYRSELTNGSELLAVAEGDFKESPDVGTSKVEPEEDSAGGVEVFGDHSRKMTTFRRTHQEG
ncbi:MAG TPA: GAF domain-containing protein [Dehalococcoidia bacterium]|nr:GAF domain-containing protein [Dehalococcoidia bacterium]